MDDLIDRAIGFAARAHETQKRKIGGVPYIAHPVGVAMILARMDCEPAVVAAGLLHDVIEDTSVTLEDIEEAFGLEVATIVSGCTEPQKKRGNWEQRKHTMIQSLRNAPLPVKLVMAADKYHNLSHTLSTKRQHGNKVWRHFGRGKGRQAWYYRGVLDSILANVSQPERYPVFGQLAEVVAELFEDVESQPPG
jgi:(p)ppGpp synthase/HD superfamily hydrolase